MEDHTNNNDSHQSVYGFEDEVYLDPSDVDSVVELVETTAHDNIDVGMSDMDLVEGDGDDLSGEVIQDNSRLTFSAHKDSVFTVRVSQSDSSIAVSGGQDDIAHVWNTSTGQLIFSCTGHSDSVTNVALSHDGALVATGDMAGLVQVWDCCTHTKVWSFECSDVEWLTWHHSAHVLICGTVDGDSWMWRIPSGDCKTFSGSGVVAGCGLIMPDGVRAAVGHEDGTVKIWDLKSGSCLHTLTGTRESIGDDGDKIGGSASSYHGSFIWGDQKGHTSSVVAMDCHHDNTLLMTGSTDTTAKFYNSVTGKVMASFLCSKGDNTDDDGVETVGLSQKHNYAAAGTLLGSLVVIDITSQIVRHTCQHQAGIVKLRWHPSDPIVFTACLDGTVRSIDARNGVFMGHWTGHRREILDFDLSRDAKLMVTSSEDSTVKVYDLT